MTAWSFVYCLFFVMLRIKLSGCHMYRSFSTRAAWLKKIVQIHIVKNFDAKIWLFSLLSSHFALIYFCSWRTLSLHTWDHTWWWKSMFVLSVKKHSSLNRASMITWSDCTGINMVQTSSKWSLSERLAWEVLHPKQRAGYLMWMQTICAEISVESGTIQPDWTDIMLLFKFQFNLWFFLAIWTYFSMRMSVQKSHKWRWTSVASLSSNLHDLQQ